MSKSVIGSLFFLVFSSFYFYNIFKIKKMPGAQFEVMTASSFPFYIGVCGIVFSILLLILSLIKKDENDKLLLRYLKTLDFKTGILFVILMLFYGYAMKTLGFIISTTIFLIAGFFILKERNLKRLFLISISVSIGFYLLLNNLLGVYIDPGFILDYFIGDK